MLYNCSVPSKTPPSRPNPCWGHTVDNHHLPTASDRFGRAPGFLWAPFGRTRPQKHWGKPVKHRKLQVVQPKEIYRTLHYDALCILMAVLLDLYHDPFIELSNDPFLFQSVTLLFPIWLCTSHRLKGASGGGAWFMHSSIYKFKAFPLSRARIAVHTLGCRRSFVCVVALLTPLLWPPGKLGATLRMSCHKHSSPKNLDPRSAIGKIMLALCCSSISNIKKQNVTGNKHLLTCSNSWSSQKSSVFQRPLCHCIGCNVHPSPRGSQQKQDEEAAKEDKGNDPRR